MIGDTHRAEALMGTAFNTEFAETFSHPLREYNALTKHVGLIDLPHWRVLRLTGADRQTFLNNLVTNDIAASAPGRGVRTLLTTIKGKLVADLYVLSRPNDLLVLIAQGDAADVLAAIDKHIIVDDVEVHDESSNYEVLAVEGPDARGLVWRLFPDEPVPLEPLSFIDVDYQGTPVTVLRNSLVGDRGYQLVVPKAPTRPIRNYLVQGGRGMDMEPIGRIAWNMRRMENGLVWFGNEADVTAANFPKEARLGNLVSYTKGCFLGQETLARMHYRGHPNWKLVGLVASADPSNHLASPDWLTAVAGEGDLRADALNDLPTLATNDAGVRDQLAALTQTRVAHGTELFAPSESGDDTADIGGRTVAAKTIGRVTSRCFSPMLGSAMLMGYVRIKEATMGNTVVMPAGDSFVELKITPLPLGADADAAEADDA